MSICFGAVVKDYNIYAPGEKCSPEIPAVSSLKFPMELSLELKLEVCTGPDLARGPYPARQMGGDYSNGPDRHMRGDFSNGLSRAGT